MPKPGNEALAEAARFAVAIVGAVFSGITVVAWLGGGVLEVVIAIASAILIFALVLIVYPKVRSGIRATARMGAPSEATETTYLRRACEVGPHEVQAGEILSLELDVREDERLEGILHEVDGCDFDWSIVDRTNFVYAFDGKRFNRRTGRRKVKTDEVMWRVPQGGPWYILLSARRRKLPRRIETELEARR